MPPTAIRQAMKLPSKGQEKLTANASFWTPAMVPTLPQLLPSHLLGSEVLLGDPWASTGMPGMGDAVILLSQNCGPVLCHPWPHLLSGDDSGPPSFLEVGSFLRSYKVPSTPPAVWGSSRPVLAGVPETSEDPFPLRGRV